MDFLKKYFAGQLTPQEEAQVQAWLVEHSEDPQVQDALLAIMSDMETEDMTVSSPAYVKVSRRLGLDRKSRFERTVRTIGRWAMGIAACVMLPLLGAFVYDRLSVPEQADWLELKVPYGQTDELVLADGTHLHLNAGTRVTYPSAFLGSERRVFIEGEVFAEVARNPEQPFIIASGDVDVKVLGTTFNFKAYDNTECVELILLEGAVQVDIDASTRTKQIQLHPGEMVQYDRKSGEIEMKDFRPHLYKGFHDDGSIHFFNLRLSDIASDLERLFGVKVVLLDEALAETRYFAWFSNNETLDQILDGINVDGRMKLRKKDNVIYISKK
ncbi:MAG: FecR domain-containing protein [Bacteroidales bacterium]|nr:FecR domain-containing protein [Bacteroidales bacterium]